MECAPEDTACRLAAFNNAAHAVVALVQRIHGAMDAVEQAVQSGAVYMAAEEAFPVVILKIHVSLIVLAIVLAVQSRVDQMAWYVVIASITTAVFMGATVWHMPAADLPMHVTALVFCMGLLFFVERKNGR